MQRLVTIIVTVIFLLAVYPNFGNSRVAACSCLAQEGVQDYADNATGVFRGKLTDQSQFSGSMMFGGSRVLTFEVMQFWKGSYDGIVKVYTAGDSAACGVALTTDVEYIVYTSEQEGKEWTTLCSGTTDATDTEIAKVEAALGQGEFNFYALDNGDPTKTPRNGGVNLPRTKIDSRIGSLTTLTAAVLVIGVVTVVNTMLTIAVLFVALKKSKAK